MRKYLNVPTKGLVGALLFFLLLKTHLFYGKFIKIMRKALA